MGVLSKTSVVFGKKVTHAPIALLRLPDIPPGVSVMSRYKPL